MSNKKLTLTKITILRVEGKEPLVSYLVYEPIDEVRKLIAESREQTNNNDFINTDWEQVKKTVE